MFNSRLKVESFIGEFEARRLPKERWTHEAHLVAGLWYTLYRGDAALDAIRAYIRAHNEAVGTPNTDTSGYHETITRLYMTAIARHVSGHRQASFEDLLSSLLASPLRDSSWPLKYYSRERLFSIEARRHWVEPDASVL